MNPWWTHHFVCECFVVAKLGFLPSFWRKLKSDVFSFSSIILVEVNEVEVLRLSQLVMRLLWLCKRVYLYTDERFYCIKVQTVQNVQM